VREPRYEDWKLLDLKPGADLAAVNRALSYRRSLYQPGALATYSLLDEDERLQMLDRIDEAYRRITGRDPPPERVTQPQPEEIGGPVITPTGPAPDPEADPGGYLRHHRLSRGLSLEQLSAETKIRAQLLDQIEHEDQAELPAAVFVRGHVLQYAKALGLPRVDDLAAYYLAKVRLD
jgi:hypothetical protein